jgi:hypothetical protein
MAAEFAVLFPALVSTLAAWQVPTRIGGAVAKQHRCRRREWPAQNAITKPAVTA